MREEKIFSPSEAAVVSGFPISAIHKAIDDGPLEEARLRRPGKRMLTEADLLYLAAMDIFDPKLVQLSDKAKERIREAITSSSEMKRKLRKISLFEGLELDLEPIVAKVRSRTALLERANKMVIVNPSIRGGEPVIRGTRIGVYEVAAMAEGATQGERAEILAGYPTLKPDQLELAKIFAAAHPRRGRPPKHPWRRVEAQARA